MSYERKAPTVTPTPASACPAAVIVDCIAGMVDDIARTQEAGFDATARGDENEAGRLDRRADTLVAAVETLRDALPGVRAESYLGAMAQVAVISAFAEWMHNADADDGETRHQLANAIEMMAHSVASFLATQGGVDRAHAGLKYFLPLCMDHLLPQQA